MSAATATTSTNSELTRICGTVIELHPKTCDNWSRAKVQLESGRTAWLTAKFRLEIDEVIEVDCTYNEKFRSYDTVKLATSENGEVSNAVVMLKLVEVLDGVGQVKARRLADKFPKLYETLINSPQDIATACGIPLATVANVADGLKIERDGLQRVTKLVEKGYPHFLAKRISRVDNHYKVALDSPYAAIKLVNGLGWLLADEVGRKQGIAIDDPKRIVAGIEHYYRDKIAGDGHTVATGDELLENSALPSLLGIHKNVIEEHLNSTLIPLENGYYTSKPHQDNARIICEFFLRTMPTEEDRGAVTTPESSS